MLGQKISQYGDDTSPVTTDYVLGNKASGPSTATFKLSDLITLFANNLPAILKAGANTNPIWQYLGQTKITSGVQTTTSTSWTAITNASITVVVPSGATLLRITPRFIMSATQTGYGIGLAVYKDGTYLDQVYFHDYVGNYIVLTPTFYDKPTSGSHTYSFYMVTSSSSSTVSFINGAGSSSTFSNPPAYITVDCC